MSDLSSNPFSDDVIDLLNDEYEDEEEELDEDDHEIQEGDEDGELEGDEEDPDGEIEEEVDDDDGDDNESRESIEEGDDDDDDDDDDEDNEDEGEEVEDDDNDGENDDEEEAEGDDEDDQDNLDDDIDEDNVDDSQDEEEIEMENDGEEEDEEGEDEDDVERDENGRKKIYRRKAVEIEKEYCCKVKKCGKLYGSYPALYTHLKTKHDELGQDKLFKLARSERSRITKLEELREQGIEIEVEEPKPKKKTQVSAKILEKEAEKKRMKKLKKAEKKAEMKRKLKEKLEKKKRQKREAQENIVKNKNRVKEFYDQKYVHLIKPGMVNKKQIKQLLKTKKKEGAIIKEAEKQITESKKQKKIEKEKIQEKVVVAAPQIVELTLVKKGPGRPKKQGVIAIRRTFGSVEQLIQKSIQKQLALADDAKPKVAKVIKIETKSPSEQSAFQPSYLFDLVKDIYLSSKDLDVNQIFCIPVDLSKEKKKPRKGQEEITHYLNDYPQLTQENAFLLEPLKLQLEYVKSLNRQLQNEEISGIGLRVAISLLFLSKYLSKAFYKEMAYFASYLLRCLSIKKISTYSESLQEFVSIYEYILNSIQYGGLVDQFPIMSRCSNLNILYNLPKRILHSLFKIIFKNNPTYPQNQVNSFNLYQQDLYQFV